MTNNYSFFSKAFRKLNRILHPQRLLQTDEFIDRLLCTNLGMLNRGNLFCIDYAIKSIQNEGAVVEIGAFCGQSTNLISYLLFKNGKKNKLFTCDCWVYEGYYDYAMLNESSMPKDTKYLNTVGFHPYITRNEYIKFVREEFARNVRMFSKPNLPYAFDGTSDEFFKLWETRKEISDLFDQRVKLGGDISFCFIDGNHYYEFVRRDFENADKFLTKGGFILFDDSADDCPFDSRKVAQEVLKDNRYRFVMKNPHYLFQKK